MKSGKFYSIGMGPGDGKLLTYKATEIMGLCDIIAVPKSGAKDNVALKIAGDYVSGKEILFLDMPMTKDKNILLESHNKATDLVAKSLDMGKTIGFLTLGDPSIYSTAMYVHRKLHESGYLTEIIPGVPSFCAVAASLNKTLCEGGETLHIIPASYMSDEDALSLRGNKVFMKSGRTIGRLTRLLREKNIPASMVQNASMENEIIHNQLDDDIEDASYFSIVLVKEENI